MPPPPIKSNLSSLGLQLSHVRHSLGENNSGHLKTLFFYFQFLCCSSTFWWLSRSCFSASQRQNFVESETSSGKEQQNKISKVTRSQKVSTENFKIVFLFWNGKVLESFLSFVKVCFLWTKTIFLVVAGVEIRDRVSFCKNEKKVRLDPILISVFRPFVKMTNEL